MATLQALQEKIAKLQSQADALRIKEQQAVIGSIHDLMLTHGLTLEDIGNPPGVRSSRGIRDLKAKGTKAKGKQPARYQNPKTGETWSGLARPPAWIKNVKDRKKFLINKDDAGAPAALNTRLKVVKTGAKAKPGKKATVPPKYRDPNSGATWSGRGTAPAWIREVEDRSSFLIEKQAA